MFLHSQLFLMFNMSNSVNYFFFQIIFSTLNKTKKSIINIKTKTE